MLTICKTCEHSIFCPTWGDYKCMHNARKYILHLGPNECKDFKERGNDFEEKPCHCDFCEVVGAYDDEKEEPRR